MPDGDSKTPKRKTVLAGNPPTSIANDGKTVLRRYRVDAVIYARTVKEARSRLREVVGMQLDDAMVVPPSSKKARPDA